jgi:hypothetical protein
MGSDVNRKEAAKEFKARKVERGIFAIRCRAAGAAWVESSPNLAASRNGEFFQLRSGSHRNHRLQEEWTARGEEAFDFEVLEMLDEDVPAMNLPDLLKEKKRKWVAELGGQALY